MRKTIPEFDHMAFLIRINILINGCWEWSGYIEKNGYGNLVIGGSTFKVHRLCWFVFNGEIKSDMVLDHICRKTHCVHGHEFTQKKDRRRCMTCRKETLRKCNLKRPSRAKVR